MVDTNGADFYACHYDPQNDSSLSTRIASAPGFLLSNVSDAFSLSSRPSATKTIYLDFTGHTTSGTSWQGGATFVTPAFSLDADFQVFSDAERNAVQEVWARVSEDFSPFDVNVTTVEPPLGDLQKSGGTDSRWGIRVVIGGDGSWMSGAAGVAYLDSFNWTSDTPCFVFADQSWKTNLNFMATCVSHETGHTLGLGHDGFNGSTYYGGRGSGETGWGPIMGNPGSVNLTQWSNGGYGGSTNKEDDLGIITSRNGFGYRPDDHGNNAETATAAPFAPAFTLSGVVGSSDDEDVFSFTTTGLIDLTISPLAAGPNLDISATLSDASGIVATSNPANKLAASFNLSVAHGTYYVAIRGTGMGDPNTTGYSSYGSLGQYTVVGTVTTDNSPSLSIEPLQADAPEGSSGVTEFTFVVTRSGDLASTTSVRWSLAGTGTHAAASSDFPGNSLPSGSITFASGEASATIAVAVVGDTIAEQDEGFTITLANSIGAVISKTSADGVIRNDDEPSSFSITSLSAEKSEGNSGAMAFTFSVTRTGAAAGAASVRWSVSGMSSTSATASDFIGAAFPSGSLVFMTGEISKTVTVNVAGDVIVEKDEVFLVTLSGPVGATLTNATAQGLIRNDDEATRLDIAVASAEKVEGNSGITPFTFTITRSGGLATTASVRWAVTSTGLNAASPADFGSRAFPSGVVSFAAQEFAKIVTLNVLGDTVVEPDERFVVALTLASGATIGTSTANGLIQNDDEASLISIGAAASEQLEGNASATAFTFTVTRSGSTKGSASIQWRVAGSSPSPVTPADFLNMAFPAGTVAFAAGETSKTISVNVLGDAVAENDERFIVALSQPTGATIGNGWATGVIRNDDEASALAIMATNAERPEGNSSLTAFVFTVTRTSGLAQAASALWTVAGSGPKPATAYDFGLRALPKGSISFAPGDTTATITVYVSGDTLVENDETFVVRLVASAGLLIVTETALGVIKNDDAIMRMLVGSAFSAPTRSNRPASVFASYTLASNR